MFPSESESVILCYSIRPSHPSALSSFSSVATLQAADAAASPGCCGRIGTCHYSPQFSPFVIKRSSSCTLHRFPVCSRPPVHSVCLLHVRGSVYNLIGLLARYLLPCSSFTKCPRTPTILMTPPVLHCPCFIYWNRPIMYLCYSWERVTETQASIEPRLLGSHNEGVNQGAECGFLLFPSCVFSNESIIPVLSKPASPPLSIFPIFLRSYRLSPTSLPRGLSTRRSSGGRSLHTFPSL